MPEGPIIGYPDRAGHAAAVGDSYAAGNSPGVAHIPETGEEGASPGRRRRLLADLLARHGGVSGVARRATAATATTATVAAGAVTLLWLAEIERRTAEAEQRSRRLAINLTVASIVVSILTAVLFERTSR